MLGISEEINNKLLPRDTLSSIAYLLMCLACLQDMSILQDCAEMDLVATAQATPTLARVTVARAYQQTWQVENTHP